MRTHMCIHIRTRKSIAAVVIRWCVPHAYLREHTQVVAALGTLLMLFLLLVTLGLRWAGFGRATRLQE